MVPDPIIELVERFKQNIETYKSTAYNETVLRVEFINPFWKALGWDMDNEAGYAHLYRDVIHEDAINAGGGTKAPDYCFRIGGMRKFFLEAKRPSVNIKEDATAAYQLRRYAWSGKLPLSVLTDFEELAVYDGRVRPNNADKASKARIAYYTYHEYIDKWDEIASVFSREAVLKGSFDKYAASISGKRGTSEIDKEFLAEIETWREALAKNIASLNPHLNVQELNYSVQMTIDRIVFLRMCEDRGIEQYAQLQALCAGKRIYPRLLEIYEKADERYNSGLFHFSAETGRPGSPDKLTPNLKIDDKTLTDIIPRLYYPDSPYEFGMIPTEILGNVYEQFLGKVIRLTKGHQAKVEEKPEVRKAGGVYYTPQYIVDYIVKNTVGKLCEGKSPSEISGLRILDPSCGSGSFLLGAYQFLLTYHLEWYLKKKESSGRIPFEPVDKANPKRGKQEAIFEDRNGVWRLTTREKKRILLNNIYGVDVDSQAVEVTKLSLLLKVLENENQETLRTQLAIWRERALPDLSDNIKCGNSLIGPELYCNGQLGLFDEESQYRINLFDWNDKLHGFGDIMAGGGFDCVIGNPPYIRIQAMKEWAPIEVEYYKKAYKSAGAGNYDIYVVFVEKGLGLLNRKGCLGFILPHKFFNSQYGAPLRGILSAGKHLSEIVHFGDRQVFTGPTTYTCLMFLDKAGTVKMNFVEVDDIAEWVESGNARQGGCSADNITAEEWNFIAGDGKQLFKKLDGFPCKLGEISDIFVGLQTSADTVFLFKEYQPFTKNLVKVFSKELGDWFKIESRILKPVVRSGKIGGYYAEATALVLFPYEIEGFSSRLFAKEEMESKYPRAWAYLNANRNLLRNREKGKFKDTQWYRLYPKNLALWEQPKLMVPYMVTKLAAYPDYENNYYFVNVTTGGFGVTVDETRGSVAYICGLINSKLLNFYLEKVSSHFHGGYFAANKQFIEKLPIRAIDFTNKKDVAAHDRMAALVETMLELHKKLQAAKTPDEKTRLERLISATGAQLDKLVYEIYELTEADIKLIEST